MKLWQKDSSIDQLIERFTIGQDRILDLELAEHDVLGSIAHAKMLHKIGMLTASELEQLIAALQDILHSVKNGTFSINEGVEDVHSQVEFLLTDQLGDIGKKIHAGRSRNDQVLVDLKLYYREKLQHIITLQEQLIHAFINKSENHKELLMPGYTHMQVGMVSSFGMWLASYGEALIDDLHLMKLTLKLVNQNPLGSAAGYGNSFPLDRKETTTLLGFDDLCYNSMYAQFTRGKSELQIAQAMAASAYTIGKFAMDVCLFCNQNYGFIKLPDHLTTGSSIMPHKKNPDVFELIRAKCNQVIALPNQIFMICNNLMSGYHRDFQQLKELVFPAIHQFIDVLEILLHCIPQIHVNSDLLNDPKYDTLFSVEEVNRLVQEGMSFRDAYLQIKTKIEAGSFKPQRALHHTHIGSIGNLGNEMILAKIKN